MNTCFLLSSGISIGAALPSMGTITDKVLFGNFRRRLLPPQRFNAPAVTDPGDCLPGSVGSMVGRELHEQHHSHAAGRGSLHARLE